LAFLFVYGFSLLTLRAFTTEDKELASRALGYLVARLATAF
jgi:hypothetical protein